MEDLKKYFNKFKVWQAEPVTFTKGDKLVIALLLLGMVLR